MFERFTERARQVVVLAQDEARTLKHNSIGTEHLLLGLLREGEGAAVDALHSLDITVEEVRGQVVMIVGQGNTVPTGQIPFTPRAVRSRAPGGHRCGRSSSASPARPAGARLSTCN
jgi:ATP-dependent Clp protease ATP-binding subunit ClpC